MKMKKICSTALVGMMMMSFFTACDSSDVKETESTTEVSVEETTEDATEEITETTTEATTTEATETEVEETETAETTEDTEPVIETIIVDNSYEFKKGTFPVLDGSTSMKPLGVALKQVLLNMDYEDADSMEFHRTTKSFEYLISGDSDLLLVANPNQSAFDAMSEANFDYEIEEIAVEGLVFMVNSTNPVDNLTTEQIRDIYSGKITNWSEVGGLDMPIAAFQRNETSGSQVMMVETVMGDTPMMEVSTEMVPGDMGGLIEAVRGYDNSSNAIGYTVYYYAANMDMADGLKIISVDGVAPTQETLASNEYPFLSHYYAVMRDRSKVTEPVEKLFDWLTSEDGQKLISLMGYVPAS